MMDTKKPQNSSLSQLLILVLADTTSLFLKTWGYHWNVVGPEFVSLHRLFGDQYGDLYGAIDEIAEHVRALDQTVPMDYPDGRHISRGGAQLSSWQSMVKDLISGHQAALQTIDRAIKSASKDDYQAVLNLLADRQKEHTRAIWMLKAVVK